MLDAQAQTGYLDLAQRGQLVIGERAGFAFEGDLLDLVPWKQLLHAIGEETAVVHAEKTGRASARVDEARLAPADERLRGVDRQFLQQGVEVRADLL